ncbi:4Fe-4S binding protein [Telmatospirillum sp. J64-1]|uniref:4Fe-4S binding protein n=1 Tax=Telmatospirillum sp. J64-1 TaxID=2502183 RepID=UPI00115E4F38|nr:4Fe-4S binding protein [Telmatospirillum sp. J64-1]
MKVRDKRVLVCSCEGTMPLDPKKIASALGAETPVLQSHLCRAQIDNFRQAASEGERLLVCCTQEAPLFAEIAEETEADVSFVNIRETAGWSDEAPRATAKIAALIAEAALDLEPSSSVSMSSEGSVLVWGHDEAALEAARRLSAGHAVTCLLGRPGNLMPPARHDFPLFKGGLRNVKGHLGAFQVSVDSLAVAAPSSRGSLAFAAPVQGSTLNFDIILDVSGEAPLFPGTRDGYLRVDPRKPGALDAALLEINGLIGEFEKPRYVRVDATICAHSRNSKVGCTRCLDACPTGSIQPAGDHISIDAHACSGHGACASVCPTGAITYDLPAAGGIFKRLTTLLSAWRSAGGTAPVLLVHDLRHGSEMISTMARLGSGLPAHVLPFAINEVTALGLDFLFVALAQGVSQVAFLTGPEHRDSLAPMQGNAALVNAAMAGLGHQGERVVILDEADPFVLADILRRPAPKPVSPAADFLPAGRKRQVIGLALTHLHDTAPQPVEAVSLPEGAPFGGLILDQSACTLCLSCVNVCPVKALGSNPDKPQLTFLENACVQCGLCRATCPEKAITLDPRLAFTEATRVRQVLKEEEPFECIKCGKPFGTKSSIERMIGRLSGHWMFSQPGKLDLIKMCEDCRVIVQFEAAQDPEEPPRLRTTEDYLREREKNKNQSS